MGLREFAARMFRPRQAEQRDITSVPWDVGGSRYTVVNTDQALSLVPVFASVRLLASQIASLPLHAYRKVGDTRTRIATPSLFTQPAAKGTLYDWLHRCVTSLALRGNAYGLITRRDANEYPTMVEWLHPDDVWVDDLAPSGPGSYTNPIFYWQGRIIPAEDLLHIAWFTVPGRVCGLSPIAACASTMSTGLSAQTYTADWFNNGAVPPGEFRNTAKTVNQTEADIISARLNAAIKRRKPLVYGNDWEYKAIAVSAHEAKFVETLKLNATQVANIFGIPPEMVGGEAGGSLTYNTTEQNGINFVKFTLRPWLELLEQAFTALTPRPQYLKFNVDALLRADLAGRMAAYQISRTIGLNNINELRALEDEPPLPNGTGQSYAPLGAGQSPAPSNRSRRSVTLRHTPNGHPHNQLDHAGIDLPDGLLTWERITSLYGDQIDEKTWGVDGFVSIHDMHGEMFIGTQYGADDDRRFEVLVDFSGERPGDDARALADQIERIADGADTYDPDADGPPVNANGLADYTVSNGFLVGYDIAGDIFVRRVDDDDRYGTAAELNALTGFDFGLSEVDELVEALREMAELSDEVVDRQSVGERTRTRRALTSTSNGHGTLTGNGRTAALLGNGRPKASARRSRPLLGAQAMTDLLARRADPRDPAAPMVRKFNPGQPRVPGGEHGGEWSATGAIKDALKLAGKIDLDPDENLLGSDKVIGDGGAIRMALTDRNGHRSLRLGIGDSGFGSRDDEAGPWRGGPDRTAAVNADRKRLRDERESLEAEWDQFASNPARRAAIEARLEELDDMDTGEVYPSGYTAKLDESAAAQLRSTVADGFAAGEAQWADLNAGYDKLDRLNAQRDRLRGLDHLFTPEEEAKWDSLTEQIERLEAQLELQNFDYTIYAEGSIPGEWADVHYRVEMDEVASGVRVLLGAVPHGSGLDLEGLDDTRAILDPAEARKFLRLLARYTSSSTRSLTRRSRAKAPVGARRPARNGHGTLPGTLAVLELLERADEHAPAPNGHKRASESVS